MSERAKRKKWFERNEQAEELEAQGKIDEALRLYEENVAEGCDVAFTYERMAMLYRRQGRIDKETEALEQAIKIEKDRGPSAQMIRLEKRLETSRKTEQRERPKPVVDAGDADARPTRRKPVAKKQKKGCMSVVVVLMTTVGLLASILL